MRSFASALTALALASGLALAAPVRALAADEAAKVPADPPPHPVVDPHYGDVLFKLSRYDEAIVAWQRALAGDNDSIDRPAIDKKIKSAKQKLGKK